MTVAVVLLMGTLFSTYGYNNTWELWGIHTSQLSFGDLRTITHSGELIAQGIDPMMAGSTENPSMTIARMNYPRVWQCLHFIGINHTHTNTIGILLIVLFLLGVCLFLRNESTATIILVSAAVLSPACLLGAERGNIDLLMFFLVAVSIVTVRASCILSSIVLFVSFLLKLFPIFGWIVLVRAGKSSFLKLTSLLVVIVGIYFIITHPDILLIREGTPKSQHVSFGINVFWMKAYDKFGISLQWLFYLLAFLICVLALSALLRNDHKSFYEGEVIPSLDVFRAGSAIYLGVFLVGGNNFDYRLIFLIFTIPQLVVWTKSSAAYINIVSKVSLFAIFISLWHIAIINWFGSIYPLLFILDEAANWIVLSCLAYLLLWSMPSWLREDAQRIYARIRSFT